MAPTRRRALHALGAGTVAALAGCNGPLDGTAPTEREYTLDLNRIDAPLAEHVLFEPSTGDLFGDPQRAALDTLYAEGSVTTAGWEPLPDGGYVENDGLYYELATAVVDRRETERTVVTATDVPEGDVPEDALDPESLPRPSRRVALILHSGARSGYDPRTTGLRRDGRYVLRLPAELDDPIAGELDGRVVVLAPDGPWAIRLDIGTERVTEPVYRTALLPVADDEAAFREVARADRVDTYLPEYDLAAASREVLDEATARGEYVETAPLSEAYRALLDTLLLADDTENGLLLETDEALFRYGLYVNEA
ncbi:hypothetical protein [Halosegnis marinus]|uniref:Uncharacterized protein n=1 Tax=Halosegnis marinus TaxID=3034023 RepID=A0ABD5ZQU3_9EURY|nr:hypothetical protein [Halosegnis sp. DT85]